MWTRSVQIDAVLSIVRKVLDPIERVVRAVVEVAPHGHAVTGVVACSRSVGLSRKPREIRTIRGRRRIEVGVERERRCRHRVNHQHILGSASLGPLGEDKSVNRISGGRHQIS